jgi:hypothetical protein
MKLRTEYNIPPSALQIKHEDDLLLYGSCFAENIGEKLQHLKYKALINPLGISYNPISLHKLLRLTKGELEAALEDKNKQKDLFYHWDFHSNFNHLDAATFEKQLFHSLKKQVEKLQNTKIIFISYGTAWVHELKSNGQLVNNCHKQDSVHFQKRLLEVDEILSSWNETKSRLRETFNSELQFVFTVSPVRHLKDGFRENQLSKSTLHLAVEKITSNSKNCHYV